MLVELSVREQRYQAVLAVVQDGWQVVEVARRLGVSRQSVHAWISRYEQGGLAAWPIAPTGRQAVPTRSHPRSRRRSVNSAESTPAGVLGGSNITWAWPMSRPSPLARPSLGA